MNEELTNALEQETTRNERNNIVAGTIGALLGSLIGVALWVIIGLAGYIAAICGLVLAICTIKGYQLFGGKLDKKGICITIIITILMVFAAEYISLVLEIYNELNPSYNITIFEALQFVPECFEDSGVSNDFYLNLALGYMFTLVASYSQFKNAYQMAKYQN